MPDAYQTMSVISDGKTGYSVYHGESRAPVGDGDLLGKLLEPFLGEDGGYSDVSFGPGRFVLDRALVLRTGMRIRGSGPATKLECRDSSAEAVIVGTDVQDVVVSDLTLSGTLQGPANGIVIDQTANGRVTGVTVAGFRGRGVWVRNFSALCSVDRCRLAGNGVAGVMFENFRHGPYGDFVPNMVSNAFIFGGGVGIDCSRAVLANISACVIHQTSGPAVVIRDRSNSVTVTGCRTFQTQNDAVHVIESDELTFTGNSLAWQVGHGIVATGCRWGTITGNTIIDVGSYNPGGPNLVTKFEDVASDLPPLSDGIRLEDIAGYSVSGNAIFNWGVVPQMASGIREDDASHHNVISANTVNYYRDADVVSRGEGTVTTGNVGWAEAPFRSTDPYAGKRDGDGAVRHGALSVPPGTVIQSFQPELTDAMIRELQ